MTKSFITLATLVLVILFTSAYYTTPADSRIGYQAPSLTVDNNNRSLSLSSLAGQYVVVTFWSSNQPQSRIENIRYQRLANRLGTFRHIAVNLDDDAQMVAALTAVDGLDAAGVFTPIEGQRDQILRSWRQSGRYSSFLIAPDGRVEATSPSNEALAKL